MPEPVHNKVKASVAGAAGGYTVGKAISVLFIYYFIGDVPPEITFAINFLIEFACTVALSAVSGYYAEP